MKKIALIIGCFLFLFFLYTGPAFADKSSVTLEGPTSVEKGSEAVIKINVTHSGNSFFHYTNWVKVEAGGKLLEQWNYSAGKRPESEKFTKEIKIKILENTEVTAEANCNMHGSSGPAKLMITVK